MKTLYKGALYSKELVHLQCNPFHSWFLHVLYHFRCCACIYALVSTIPHLQISVDSTCFQYKTLSLLKHTNYQLEE